MSASPVATAATPVGERLARAGERTLRLLGDARLGLALLLLAGASNAVAALLPGGPASLDGWPYAVLLGLVALTGIAAVAVRSPTVWREWRRPTPVQAAPGTLRLALPEMSDERLVLVLRASGYRTRTETGRSHAAIHGVRRGWSRYAALGSHLALVVVVLGVAIGSAFGSEVVFSLLRGDQALLDAPRPGFASAVRLEEFDAEFGPDARPRRLDTTVTFLRHGEAVDRSILRVNEPAGFDGYLVHPWTYGPAVRLRVATLGGATLLDAAIPLDGSQGGAAVGSAELPSAGITLGLALADAARNELGVSAIGADGLIDTVRLRPGERARLGPVEVEVQAFDAWVTFVSRRDPGVMIVFGGAAAMSAALAIGFWLPRRRLTVRRRAGSLELLLRGERFDRAEDELRRLSSAFGASA